MCIVVTVLKTSHLEFLRSLGSMSHEPREVKWGGNILVFDGSNNNNNNYNKLYLRSRQ